MKTQNNRVILIGFYNEKALGVRYLANALEAHGFEPHIIFFQGFNSVRPQKASKADLALLRSLVSVISPLFVGLSVMSSLYLETVYEVNDMLRTATEVPIVWGGVYATLLPEEAARHCDYVMRGEGEKAIVALADALQCEGELRSLPNLAYWDGERVVVNDVLPLEQDLDRYGYPKIGGAHMYRVDGGRVRKGDPQLSAYTYELSASRGCPFSCSYCSSVNLRRVYQGKGRYVRFRSVDSVLAELREAREKIPRLKVVHFWDEIFCDEPGWVEEFAERYPREVGLPFRIWGHPLKTDARIVRHLVQAGLHQVVTGIQSGSPRVRHDIFHRPETQEQIIEASRILSDCGVPQIVYDFMLCHPFETESDRAETFALCTRLKPPFRLNIHGLNFLPATDILTLALEQGICTEQELHEQMYGTIREQFDRYWGPNAQAFAQASGATSWPDLIYLTQFPRLRKQVLALAAQLDSPKANQRIRALKHRMERRVQLVSLADKARLFLGW